MPTKNVNTNINNIKIEIPKQKQYRPKTKSIATAEEELNQLEQADAGYNAMPHTSNITINPSVYGYSHLPIQRDITQTSAEENMMAPPEPVSPMPVAPPMEAPPMEAPPMEASKKRIRGPNRLKKYVEAIPIASSAKPYLQSYPQFAEILKKSDFAKKASPSASGEYILSKLDKQLGVGKVGKVARLPEPLPSPMSSPMPPPPPPTPIKVVVKPRTKKTGEFKEPKPVKEPKARGRPKKIVTIDLPSEKLG